MTDFEQAVDFARNISNYDETPIATTDEEWFMAYNLIKKRQQLSWAAFSGSNKNADVEKIY